MKRSTTTRTATVLSVLVCVVGVAAFRFALLSSHARTSELTVPGLAVVAAARHGLPLAVGRANAAIVFTPCTLFGDGPDARPDEGSPGARNPAVTPSTTASTICRAGYAASIRPPERFTGALKRRQMRAWGFRGATDEIEEDHLVPLSLGGAPSDSRNLWPEPGGIPNVKDTLEHRLHRLVCDGRIPLGAAQAAIASNWNVAYETFIGPLPLVRPDHRDTAWSRRRGSA